MLMSHAAASAGEIGCPRWGLSAAEAAPAQASSAPAATMTARLPDRSVPDTEVSNVNIGHLPFRADAPTGDHVAMFHRERGHVRRNLGRAALGQESHPARLHIAALIGRPAEQNR